MGQDLASEVFVAREPADARYDKRLLSRGRGLSLPGCEGSDFSDTKHTR